MTSGGLNLKPFRKILHRLNKALYKRTVEGKSHELRTRAYGISSLTPWLLFDLRNAPQDRLGFRIIDIQTILKYYNPRRVDNCFGGRENPEAPPLNWIEVSIDVLVAEEIILDNCKSGEHRRFKPGKFMTKYWEEVEIIEGQYNPYSEEVYNLSKLSKEQRRIKIVLRELCRLTGCPMQI